MEQYTPNESHKLLVIRGSFYGEKTFPSLNNLLAEYGRNPKAGGRLKKQVEDIVIAYARQQLRGYKAENPVILHYRFFEPARGQKRDFMNVFSMADKAVEDALQKVGVLENDDPKHLLNTTHDFYYTTTEPYIEVYIEEV